MKESKREEHQKTVEGTPKKPESICWDVFKMPVCFMQQNDVICCQSEASVAAVGNICLSLQ